MIDAQFEEWMARKRAEMAANPQPETGPRILPTVVHIIYRDENDAWNISNAQVLSQIQVLNEDFMRQNPDTGNTPIAFRPVASNSDIQFCLAQQDPSGNPTNGIIRHAFPNTTCYRDWETNKTNIYAHRCTSQTNQTNNTNTKQTQTHTQTPLS